MNKSSSMIPALLGLALLLVLPGVSLGNEDGGSEGIAVEIVAAVHEIEAVEFTDFNATIVAETLAKDTRPGPSVRVYPSSSPLSVSGRWREAGEQRSWKGSIPWSAGDSVLLELGGTEDGVRVVREP